VVDDIDAFNNHPWGRKCFLDTLRMFKRGFSMLKGDKLEHKYDVYRLLLTLQIVIDCPRRSRAHSRLVLNTEFISAVDIEYQSLQAIGNEYTLPAYMMEWLVGMCPCVGGKSWEGCTHLYMPMYVNHHYIIVKIVLVDSTMYMYDPNHSSLTQSQLKGKSGVSVYDRSHDGKTSEHLCAGETGHRKGHDDGEAANIGGKIRQELSYMLKDEKDGIKQATKGMHSSKFCLNIAGDTPSSNRLFDAIASHCVPVMISDDVELSNEDVLDYSEFCIFIRTSDALKKNFLTNLIRSIGKEEWTRKWKRLKEVENFYEFRYPSKDNDAIQMIWQAVARKVPAMKRKLHKARRFCHTIVSGQGEVMSVDIPRNFW
ncbi:probable arabinosyltransferase ARAD1, partial [Olea europaea subsp. europaea]